MLSKEAWEWIRRSYYLDHKSIHQIAKQERYSVQIIEKPIANTPPRIYHLTRPKPAPVFGPSRARVEVLLYQITQFPCKQRYTTHKIFEILREKIYQGIESRIRQYLTIRKQVNQMPNIFLSLESESGQDAPVDWDEVIAVINGCRKIIPIYQMRLCYLRQVFAVAFPPQAQECFLYSVENVLNATHQLIDLLKEIESL